MKLQAVASIALSLLVGLASRLPGSESTTTEAPLGGSGGALIRFTAAGDSAGARRILSRVTADGRSETIRDTAVDENTSVFPFDAISKDPFRHAEILKAFQKGDEILVLFRLKPAALKLNGISPDMSDKYSAYKKEWDGYHSLLRSFTREPDGMWSVHLSVFLETMWGDIVAEKVTGVEITGADAYSISYKGTWKTHGDLTDRYADKYKTTVTTDGVTIKKLLYDPGQKLLFSITDDGHRSYTKGACWWASFDEYNQAHQSPLSIANERKRQAEQCEKHGILPVEYRFIRKGTARENDASRPPVLRLGE